LQRTSRYLFLASTIASTYCIYAWRDVADESQKNETSAYLIALLSIVCLNLTTYFEWSLNSTYFIRNDNAIDIFYLYYPNIPYTMRALLRLRNYSPSLEFPCTDETYWSVTQ